MPRTLSDNLGIPRSASSSVPSFANEETKVVDISNLMDSLWKRRTLRISLEIIMIFSFLVQKGLMLAAFHKTNSSDILQ